MLQNNPILKSKIDQLWDKFWSGGIANPLTAIEQITYLLFIKRLDDLDLKQQADAEFTGDTFTSRFSGDWVPPEHRDKSKKDQKPFAVKKEDLRWSVFKRKQTEDMFNHVQGKVFPFLKDINGRESHFTDHMKNAVFMIAKPSLLVEAIEKTFENRNTPITVNPTAFDLSFTKDEDKKAQWLGFIKKAKLTDAPGSFEEVAAAVRVFLEPIVASIVERQTFLSIWTAPGPWR